MIKGHVLKPSFELEGSHLVKQGGIAVALGTVLTPLAAVLAFVDPGLAKNQNCARSTNAGGKSAVRSTPARPHATPPSKWRAACTRLRPVPRTCRTAPNGLSEKPSNCLIIWRICVFDLYL